MLEGGEAGVEADNSAQMFGPRIQTFGATPKPSDLSVGTSKPTEPAESTASGYSDTETLGHIRVIQMIVGCKMPEEFTFIRLFFCDDSVQHGLLDDSGIHIRNENLERQISGHCFAGGMWIVARSIGIMGTNPDI